MALPLNAPWKRLWAVTPYERVRLRSMLDAVVAELYGLNEQDLEHILRDCDHPQALLGSSEYTRAFDPKGFWRVDRELDPEVRHPVLTLVAFHALKQQGLDAFLGQNDGEGWMLPDQLRLADYGLGHDARAKTPQPVGTRLGPRFLDWQLSQGVEDSWAECERHADQIRQIRARGMESPEPPAHAGTPQEAAPESPRPGGKRAPRVNRSRPSPQAEENALRPGVEESSSPQLAMFGTRAPKK